MTELLDVHGLATGYGDLQVLWDLGFSVREGEVLALLGRNGAGKTTALRAVMGLTPLYGGTIEFAGEDLTRLPAHQRVRRGIGIVQEGKRLIGDMTVEDNLRLGAHVRRWSRGELRERIDRSYDMFPALRDRRAAPAALLSGGQQQMLAIAQALMSGPRLLLVDEPSAGLAPAVVGEVLEILARLRETGLSIVLVEQSVDFALSIASRIVVVDLGRSVLAGRTDEPGVRDAVRQAYLQPVGTGAGRAAPTDEDPRR